ncbi:hypothetical protein RvY_04843 [Ramazzottius varieornatus]|uniref:Glycosyl transferase family 1 domain-containing protein n=1 Tax=Ramazzottius varieornatus TaxID=947166 RepID=A0A1D1UW86_RAMVA|nr:hypothetical protein RvY_04843 [Ramazzottius varieornatus]
MKPGIRSLRIAQVAPLFESCPPQLYGGTERIVSYLTEELVKEGHQVTLFASGDSITEARLIPCVKTAIRLNPAIKIECIYSMLMFEKVLQMEDQFDIIHFHTDFLSFGLFRHLASKCITTIHGRCDIEDLPLVYAEYKDMKIVSISDNQRIPLLGIANFYATVYHGIPPLRFSLTPFNGGYLAFLGRISPEKRPDRAIEIAQKAGIKLRIAAKVDKADQEYYDREIKPMIDGNPLVEFIGEINQEQKSDFLGNAIALAFPIDWPEPFGIVMIEAMSCGTPVIAYPHGSVREVIDDGISGILVESIEEAVAAVPRAAAMDRRLVRKTFDDRFSVPNMAKNYIQLYEKMLHAKKLEDSTKTSTLIEQILSAADGGALPMSAINSAIKQQAA